MNILFIDSRDVVKADSKPLTNPLEIQFGISYISSFLKKHGHNTRLLLLSQSLDQKRNEKLINEFINDFNPKLICFTSVATQYQFIASIVHYIKSKYRNLYLLGGGPHISLNPEEAIEDDFDAICISEGEYPTLELVEQLEQKLIPSKISNLWIKNNSKIEKNITRSFNIDLDSLPFPDREMWNEWIDVSSEERFGSAVLLGRGCPFLCTYCSNHSLKKLADGKYVRFRSVNNIILEIKEINSQNPLYDNFYLEVETILINKNWVLELCSNLELLNKSLASPLSFGVNLRIAPNKIHEEIFAAFQKANFKLVNIGLESGSKRVRRGILNRNYSNQDVIDTVLLAKKYGMKICFYNMIGIPGETLSDFKETIKLNRILQPDITETSIFYPYPGTKLYDIAKQKGLLEEPLDPSNERKRARLNLSNFSKKQIQRQYNWFNFNVYYDYKPFLKLFINGLIREIRSKPRLSFLLIVIRILSKIKKYIISIILYTKNSFGQKHFY